MKHYVNGSKAASEAVLSETLRQTDERLHLFVHWMVLIKPRWIHPYLNGLPQQSSHCVPLALFPHGYHHLLPPQTFTFFFPCFLFFLVVELSSLLAEALHLSSVKAACLLGSRVEGVSEAPHQLVLQQTVILQHSCKPLLFWIRPFIHSLSQYHRLSIFRPLPPFTECSCICLPSCPALSIMLGNGHLQFPSFLVPCTAHH